MAGSEQRLRERLVAHRIPTYLHDGLVRYLLHGIKPGGYLCAVLGNDLAQSVFRVTFPATSLDTAQLIRFFAQDIPDTAWGSYEKLEAWCQPTEHRAPMPYDGPEPTL